MPASLRLVIAVEEVVYLFLVDEEGHHLLLKD